MSIYNYLRIKYAEVDPLFDHQRAVEQPYRDEELDQLQAQNKNFAGQIAAGKEYEKGLGTHIPGTLIGALLGGGVSLSQLHNAASIAEDDGLNYDDNGNKIKPVSTAAMLPSALLYGLGGYTLADANGVKSPLVKTMATLGGGALGYGLQHMQGKTFKFLNENPPYDPIEDIGAGSILLPTVASLVASPIIGGYIGNYYGNKFFNKKNHAVAAQIAKNRNAMQNQINSNTQRITKLNDPNFLYEYDE